MTRAIDRLEPFQRAISKAHLAAAGVNLDALDSKPLIAIANSWNELCPGHEPLRKLAEEVKKGILEAGGEPIEFNTIAMCDGIAQGHAGMRYCLPHRELVADGVNGFLFAPGDMDTLAECMLRIYADPGLALRMGQAGYARARHYTVDAVAETLIPILEVQP